MADTLQKAVLPSRANIKDFVNLLQQKITDGGAVSVESPVTHHFSDNIYCREILMHAGTVVIGKEHATRHLNIILSGECEIWTVQEHIHCKPGMIFETLAGVQKVVKMITDVRFLTIHFNPDNLRKDRELEELYIKPAEQLCLFPELDSLPLFKNSQELLS